MDIFCQIVNRQVDASVVHENERFLVILDHEPFSRGHLLILPKTYYEAIVDMEDAVLCEMISLGKILSQTLMNTFQYKGIVVLMNLGAALDIPHLHMHIYGMSEDFEEKGSAALLFHERKEYNEETRVMIKEGIEAIQQKLTSYNA